MLPLRARVDLAQSGRSGSGRQIIALCAGLAGHAVFAWVTSSGSAAPLIARPQCQYGQPLRVVAWSRSILAASGGRRGARLAMRRGPQFALTPCGSAPRLHSRAGCKAWCIRAGHGAAQHPSQCAPVAVADKAQRAFLPKRMRIRCWLAVGSWRPIIPALLRRARQGSEARRCLVTRAACVVLFADNLDSRNLV